VATGRASIGSIRSVERTRRGFVLHFDEGSATLRVSGDDRRQVEAALRGVGLTIVDEWGARVDESQFVKEQDPRFNRRVGPGFFVFLVESFAPLSVVGWLHRRRVRQSSDDA
jgi:hypothetical protein